LGLFSGGLILTGLMAKKVFWHEAIFVEHGPLMVLGGMLCLFGVQILAVGLIGELLTRTHFESRENPMYRIELVQGNSLGYGSAAGAGRGQSRAVASSSTRA
jgi:hypothetical protein